MPCRPPPPLTVPAVALLAAVLLAACSPAGPADRPAATAGAGPPAGQPGGAPAITALPGTVGPSSDGRPRAGRAPAERFAVGVRTLTVNRGGDRRLPVTVWYPARGAAGGPAGEDAAAAAGRFPVVLFSHGLGGRPADYRSLLTGWAGAGFVVAAPRYPLTSRGSQVNPLDVLNQPADASFVLDAVLALDGRAGDRLRGRLDRQRVAAAGHSAGAITTVGMFTGNRDPRLRAGIMLAGSSLGFGTRFTGPAAPLLFVHGERDDVVSYAAGRALYEAVPWPKALLSLPEGGHAVDPAAEAFDVVARSTTNFLRWSLYGDQAARGRLDDGTGGGTARWTGKL